MPIKTCCESLFGYMLIMKNIKIICYLICVLCIFKVRNCGWGAWVSKGTVPIALSAGLHSAKLSRPLSFFTGVQALRRAENGTTQPSQLRINDGGIFTLSANQ